MRRHDLLDAVAGLELEVLHKAEQKWIGHGNGQHIFLEADGHAHAPQRHFLGDQHDSRRVGRILCEVDVGETELERERLRNLFVGREIHAHEHHADAFAGALALRQCSAEIILADEARLDQALTDLLTHASLLIS